MSWLDDCKNEGVLGSTKDHQAYRTSCLVGGEFGSGKTHFAMTFPKPFLLNYDRGEATGTAMNVDVKKIDFKAQSKVYKRTMEILKDARDRTGPFSEEGEFFDIETIIIDGATALSRMILYEVMAYPTIGTKALDPTKDKPEFDHWAFLGARMEQIFNLVRELPFHVVVTSALKLSEDDVTKQPYGEFLVDGSFRQKIGGFFDEVYIMTTKKERGEDKAVTYEMYPNKFKYWQGKSRWGLTGVVVDPSFDTIDKLLAKARPPVS